MNKDAPKATLNRLTLVDPLNLPKTSELYEGLTGATGPEAFYRPRRIQMARMFPPPPYPNPTAEWDLSSGNEIPLLDAALRGVAVSVDDPSVTRNDLLQRFKIFYSGEILYSGKARVAHVTSRSVSGPRVGIHLLDDILDINRLSWLGSTASLKVDLRKVRQTLAGDVSDLYRKLTADYMYVLSRLKAQLDHRERSFASEKPEHRIFLEEEIRREIWPLFLESTESLRTRIEEYSLCIDAKDRPAYKKYTEFMLLPYALEAPFAYRARVKPLRYPGDYLTLHYVYENDWEGDSLFGRLYHKLCMEHPLSQSVRSRKDYLKDTLHSAMKTWLARENRPARPFHILCVASGPAREVADFLREVPYPEKIRITLVDQESQALSYASREISGLLKGRGDQVEVDYLYVSTSQLTRELRIRDVLSNADLIYSAGFFDYMPKTLAGRFLRTLFALLEPGGDLVVGNIAAPQCERHRWVMDYLFDWSLLYRTHDELLDLAAPLTEKCETIGVDYEHTGLNAFLVLRKRS